MWFTVVTPFIRWFLKPPGSYLGLIMVLVGGLWLQYERGYWACEDDQKQAAVAAQLQIVQADLHLTTAIDALHTSVDLGFNTANLKLQTLVQIQIKEVPVYVPNTGYPVSCGLVRMHDAALLGVPAASLDPSLCGRDDQPSPTKSTNLAGTIVNDWDYTRKVENQRDALKAELEGLYLVWDRYREELKNGK